MVSRGILIFFVFVCHGVPISAFSQGTRNLFQQMPLQSAGNDDIQPKTFIFQIQRIITTDTFKRVERIIERESNIAMEWFATFRNASLNRDWSETINDLMSSPLARVSHGLKSDMTDLTASICYTIQPKFLVPDLLQARVDCLKHFLLLANYDLDVTTSFLENTKKMDDLSMWTEIERNWGEDPSTSNQNLVSEVVGKIVVDRRKNELSLFTEALNHLDFGSLLQTLSGMSSEGPLSEEPKHLARALALQLLETRRDVLVAFIGSLSHLQRKVGKELPHFSNLIRFGNKGFEFGGFLVLERGFPIETRETTPSLLSPDVEMWVDGILLDETEKKMYLSNFFRSPLKKIKAENETEAGVAAGRQRGPGTDSSGSAGGASPHAPHGFDGPKGWRQEDGTQTQTSPRMTRRRSSVSVRTCP